MAIDNRSGRERGAASWRPARSAAAKKWMQRFRQRWNLTLGRLPAKDLLPSATMQTKARPESRRKVATVVPPSVAFWGPQDGPRLGAVRSFSVRNGGAKTEPFFGQFFVPGRIGAWHWFQFRLGQAPHGAWCLVPGARCLVPGAWRLVLSAWRLVGLFLNLSPTHRPPPTTHHPPPTDGNPLPSMMAMVTINDGNHCHQ